MSNDITLDKDEDICQAAYNKADSYDHNGADFFYIFLLPTQGMAWSGSSRAISTRKNNNPYLFF